MALFQAGLELVGFEDLRLGEVIAVGDQREHTVGVGVLPDELLAGFHADGEHQALFSDIARLGSRTSTMILSEHRLAPLLDLVAHPASSSGVLDDSLRRLLHPSPRTITAPLSLQLGLKPFDPRPGFLDARLTRLGILQVHQ